MTDRIYDDDSHQKEFEAMVISCEEVKKGFELILDKTAFFPEGGGQAADGGEINGEKVYDVQEKDGIVYHYLKTKIEPGQKVHGKINWEDRLIRMQNHSGEHIVSGIVNRIYGYNNVGFHLGEDEVTLDFDGVLTREQLDEVEYLANVAVAENVDVNIEYFSGEILNNIEYRSKLDINENVRIVTFKGYDKCACCAPHVKRTGEIGIIKLLNFYPFKNGIRIHMLAGLQALIDYRNRYKNTVEISAMLSAKQHETALAVERLMTENKCQKENMDILYGEIIDNKIKMLEQTEGNILFFEPLLNMISLRKLVDRGKEYCSGVCAGFVGDEEKGYNYIIGSKSTDLKAEAKNINNSLNGKGGGSSSMIQGNMSTNRERIEEFFRTF